MIGDWGVFVRFRVRDVLVYFCCFEGTSISFVSVFNFSYGCFWRFVVRRIYFYCGEDLVARVSVDGGPRLGKGEIKVIYFYVFEFFCFFSCFVEGWFLFCLFFEFFC